MQSGDSGDVSVAQGLGQGHQSYYRTLNDGYKSEPFSIDVVSQIEVTAIKIICFDSLQGEHVKGGGKSYSHEPTVAALNNVER